MLICEKDNVGSTAERSLVEKLYIYLIDIDIDKEIAL